MRGEADANGVHDPVPYRVFYPAGQYNPQPEALPSENTLPPPATNYTMGGLDSYTVYEFQVLAQNNIGKVASTWAGERTLEAG